VFFGHDFDRVAGLKPKQTFAGKGTFVLHRLFGDGRGFGGVTFAIGRNDAYG
jgi:hypothetical protein